MTPRYVELPATPAALVTLLEQAGATLLAMPAKGCRPSQGGVAWPEYVNDVHEAYGYGETEMPPPPPTNRQIGEMDEIYAWIRLLPPDRVVYRRLLWLRSLRRADRDRHVFSWRKCGVKLGCDHKSALRWHGDAVLLVWARLVLPTVLSADGKLIDNYRHN